jgi:transposase-like protein
MTETTPSPLNNVITIDDERIKSHLDRVVRESVEETLNALLEAEAARLCKAQRYERSEARRDTRAGHYERKLQTKAGEVRFEGPQASGADLRDGDYRALPASRELVRRGADRDVSGRGIGAPVEDITEALWGTRVSPSTVWEPGAIGRSRASTHMFTSTASCSSAAGLARCATSRCWLRSA